MPIPNGVYRHFKGRYYLVLGEALHSESNEEMVVYQPLYGDSRWFVRPKSMFLDIVERDGMQVPRFAFMGSELPKS